MTNFILKFGKHKGSDFLSTPKYYQTWILNQPWFKAPVQSETLPLHRQSLSGWDGYSKRGEAIYDAIFEQDKLESEKMYCGCGRTKEWDEPFCGMGCNEEHGW